MRVLPMGLTGTERLFPIGEGSLNPVPLTLRIGGSIDVAALRAERAGDRQLMMDALGRAIAQLLPPEYRGTYGS